MISKFLRSVAYEEIYFLLFTSIASETTFCIYETDILLTTILCCLVHIVSSVAVGLVAGLFSATMYRCGVVFIGKCLGAVST